MRAEHRRAIHRVAIRALLSLAVVSLLVPAVSLASGARQGVKARPGEIVLLRDVSARAAYRPAPPGMALIADPSPKGEIDTALGSGELSDEEYASLGAGTAPGHAPMTTVERMTDRAVGTTLGGMTGQGGTLSGTGLNQTMAAPMGAVGTATRGIGDQVRSALSQFPLLSQPATTPPPGG